MVKKEKPKSFFEKLEGEIVHEAEDYISYKAEKVKQKVLRIGEISLLIILGFFLISVGLAFLMAAYVPILGNGFSFLILGVIFLLISFLMKV